MSLVLSCFAPSVQRSENALNFPLSSNLIILILSVDVSEATDLMHSTNFIQVVSQGLVKLNWGMLCLLINTSTADLPTKYVLFLQDSTSNKCTNPSGIWWPWWESSLYR